MYMHEEYITAVQDTEDYDEKQYDEWINDIEVIFTSTERMSHEYTKRVNDNDSTKLDNSVPTNDEKLSIKVHTECDRCETLRDFERMELINEAEKIKKLLLRKELDDNTLTKLMKDSQADMKNQLERCKNAQAQYLATLERSEVQSELSWTDSIHDIYSEITTMIALSMQKGESEAVEGRK